MPRNPIWEQKQLLVKDVYIDIRTLSTQGVYLLEFFQCWGYAYEFQPNSHPRTSLQALFGSFS